MLGTHTNGERSGDRSPSRSRDSTSRTPLTLPGLGLYLLEEQIVIARPSPDGLFIELSLESIRQLSRPLLVLWHFGITTQPTTELGLESDDVTGGPEFPAFFVRYAIHF